MTEARRPGVSPPRRRMPCIEGVDMSDGIDREHVFDIVKRARAVLSVLPERAVSEATKQQYAKDFKLMLERGNGQFHPEEGTQSKRTFYRRRAAATFCCQQLLGWGLAEQDKAQKAGDWGKVGQHVRSLEFALSILERFPPQKTSGDALKAGAVCPLEAPKPRRSKRQGLAHLPADWRQRMWEIIPSASKYRAAIAVLQLAGARPSELERGVEVFAEYDGSLRVAIHGTKRGIDGHHGRETRVITIANETPAAMWLWYRHILNTLLLGRINTRRISPQRQLWSTGARPGSPLFGGQERHPPQPQQPPVFLG